MVIQSDYIKSAFKLNLIILILFILNKIKQFKSKSIFVLLLLFCGSAAICDEVTPLDRTLKPGSSDEVSSLFENVVAVQRKAKQKKNKFLVAPMFSLDFSDAPFTMYSLGLSLGYAPSEYWEFYINYIPTFITNERNISKQVKELRLASGEQASIETEKAKSYLGLELNWVPIYGKDSWGPYGIVRSDTFINFAFGQVKYEVNSGNKYKLMLGKTFFFSEYWNFRVQAGPSYLDTFSQNKKQSILIGLIEAGLVYYF